MQSLVGSILFLMAGCTSTRSFLIACYFTNWSQHRQGLGHFTPKNIDPTLCTHLYYAFVNIDVKTRSPSSFEINDMTMYEEFNRLKNRNRQMKTLLTLGGASVNSTQFRMVFESDRIRRDFIRNTIKYLRKYRFDGLDLDWEFSEMETDRRIFASLVRDYRSEFYNEASRTNRSRLLLTAAVAAYRPKIEVGYDIKEIVLVLDYINLMTYDYHGYWNSYIGFNSPLFLRSMEKDDRRFFNQQATIDTWINGGCPPSKLVLGLSAYGRTFRLKHKINPDVKPYAPSKGAGLPGNYTGNQGFLSYYEICHLIRNQKWKNDYDYEQHVSFAYKNDQWVFVVVFVEKENILS